MSSKNIKEEMKRHFFRNPTEKLGLRQIEKKLDMSFPSVVRYAKELEEEGILKSSAVGNMRLYSADRASKVFIFEKRLFNMSEINNSGLLEFLIDRCENPVIVLFGSYFRGEDTENSDIDIFVEFHGHVEICLEKFEKILGRRIHIIMEKSMRSIKNKELANNIANGMVFNGFIEVFK